MVNPDSQKLQNELEVFELMIAGYVGSIVRAAKAIPVDRWNWSFSERTPTPRETCEHTFMWLWCDRQQLTQPDWSLHQPTPPLPPDRNSMIQLLQEEATEWRRLIRSMRSEELNEERASWDGQTRLVRSFLFHMGQHVIYKAGHMWMIAFELEVDGPGPYRAPTPNEEHRLTGAPPWPSPRS